MIQSIEIKNFKSIKSKYFPLRNLSVVLGMNGQGKSSFIQSLLLLRQSEKLSDGILKLNEYSKEKEYVSFALQFKDTEPYLMEFLYEINTDVFKQKKDQQANLTIILN